MIVIIIIVVVIVFIAIPFLVKSISPSSEYANEMSFKQNQAYSVLCRQAYSFFGDKSRSEVKDFVAYMCLCMSDQEALEAAKGRITFMQAMQLVQGRTPR